MTTQRFEQHEKHVAQPKDLADSHVSQQVQNMQQTERPSSFKQSTADHTRAMEGAGTLPKLQLVGDAQKTLGDSKASAADKLSSVENLSKHGIKNIQVADSDGKMRDYSIETHKSGDRNMVHLYGKDDNGQNRIALRGVDNGNGTFSHEKDKSGKDVDFKGSKWGDSGTKGSNVSATSDAQGGAVKTPDVQPARPGQPAASAERGLNATPEAPKVPELKTPTGETKKPDLTAPPVDSKKPEAAKPADGKQTKPDVQSSDSPENYKINRADFANELNKPGVKEMFAARVNSEVGSQGQAARTAFAEELFNRAASRGTKDGVLRPDALQRAINDPNYYPGRSTPSDNPQDIAKAKQAIDTAFAGSDTTHGATGNASKGVSFGRGWHTDAKTGDRIANGTTKIINGERFGVEYNDQNKVHDWMSQYAARKVYSDDAAQIANK